MSITVAKPPPGTGRLELGRTIPSLLDEAVDVSPNEIAFNQRDASANDGWQRWSNRDFKRQTEQLALGLRAAGLEAGDRVALFTQSDMSFVIGDMACLIGGLVDVPVYLTHTPSAIEHILTESQCRAVLVTDRNLLERMTVLAAEVDSVKLLAVADPRALDGFVAGAAWSPARGRRVTSYAALEEEGAEVMAREPRLVEEYKAALDATSLATIIYTSGTTGVPKGVMLSHQNLTSNAIAAMTDIGTYQRGPSETVLSFLPLSHIFARTLQYANMWFGSSVYYGTPDSVREDLLEVRPTFMAAVPRVLEKSWERIEAAGDDLSGFKSVLYRRALAFAHAYDVLRPATGVKRLEQRLLDRLVYARWREALGGRIKMIIVGGAALRPELVNSLGAAGIEVLQGYGLTETSPVMTFNRPGRNRPGTVGEVLTGTEVGLTEEGEILARGPNVMMGYFARPEETAEIINADGWLHTGDLGELQDGYLSITGRIKYLFKLSTGKYVTPEPLTDRLEAHPLISTAIVTGDGQKYCTALLFLDHEALNARYGAADESVLRDARLRTDLEAAVTTANLGMPHWSTVKRAAAVLEVLSMETGDITPKLSVRRDKVIKEHRPILESLYREAEAPPNALFVAV